MDYIFQRLSCSVKINLAFGFVMQNVGETDVFKYFYPANNNTVFSVPIVLSDRDDLQSLKERIDREELHENLLMHRNDTKWKVYTLTNVSFFLYHMKDFPLGCGTVNLPDILLKNKEVMCLLRDRNSRNLFNDNLCMIRALAYELFGQIEYVERTMEVFSKFLRYTNQEPDGFPGVAFDQIPILEKILSVNVQVYSVYFDNHRQLLGELCHRSEFKFKRTVNVISFNAHICWVSDINSILKKMRCYNCDQFFDRSFNLERHLKVCDGQIKHVYPNGPYQLKDSVFDRLLEVGVEVSLEQQKFRNLAVFDFESITVSDDQLKATDSTTWVGRHVPISVSIASNLLDNPLFLCNRNPEELVRQFIDQLLELSKESERKMREALFFVFEKLEAEEANILNQLPRVDDDDNLSSNLFIDDQSTETELDIDQNVKLSQLKFKLRTVHSLREEFTRYCRDLPVFGFNSSRYDLNLIKEPLLNILMKERNCSPSVVRKNNQIIGMNFLGLQFLDIMNFLGGSVSLDKFLKAYGMTEQKGYFPYEWFDDPDKLQVTHLPQLKSFFSKLKNCNVLGVEYDEFIVQLRQGLSENDALKKLKLVERPKTISENYSYLQQIWKNEKMLTFEDYLKWYNNKDVRPTLIALQKMMGFYHARDIDMLKLGLTLPNLANRILHSSRSAKFFPFNKMDSHYDTYIRSWLTGGPSIIFTRYAKANVTKIGTSENICKSIVGIDASQLYPYSMTKLMPSGPYVKWEFSNERQLFIPKRNYRSHFELMTMSFQQYLRPECQIQTAFTHKKQKRIGRFFVDGYCHHCSTVFEANGCYYHFCQCQEAKTKSLQEFEEGHQRRLLHEKRKQFLIEQGFSVIEVWECEWNYWMKYNFYGLKTYMQNCFPPQPPMTRNQLVQKILDDSLFGVIDCELEVPEHLREKFDFFPPIFKTCEVGREDIGDHMKEFAAQNLLLKKPRKMLISSMKLERGPLISPLLKFYLSQGLILGSVFFFLQYKPKKCFEPFLQ